jgi:hypothetical protein
MHQQKKKTDDVKDGIYEELDVFDKFPKYYMKTPMPK